MQFVQQKDATDRAAQTLVYENGTVWAISTSTWGGNDRLRAADLGLEDNQVEDIFKLGTKSLISDQTRIFLQGARSKVQGLMGRIGRPFLIRGTYFVPNRSLPMAQEGLNRIRAEQKERVEEFLTRYEEIKADRINQYPVLKDASWPTYEQIRRAFDIKYLVFEVRGAEARETDPADLIEAKRKFAAELNGAYEELRDEILKEAHKAIVDTCEDIATKILETGEKITAATLKKPKSIIEQYLNVASIFDSNAIKAEIARLQETLNSVEAKDIRSDNVTAENFARAMRSLGDDIGDLSGYNSEGRLKRKLNLNQDEKKAA